MSFIANSPLSLTELKTSPPLPPSGTRGLFATPDGWYEVDDKGNIKKLGTGDGIPVPIENGEGANSIQQKGSNALSGLALSKQEISYVSCQSGVLTLSASDNFFDNNEIFGFRIVNAGTNNRRYIDIVKVLSSEKVGDNWEFTIEEPIAELNLESEHLCVIYAIVKDESVIADNQYAGGDDSYSIAPSAIADGEKTLAGGEFSNTRGWGTATFGRAGDASGYNTIVWENYGSTEGCHTEAGYGAHAENNHTQALGKYSHTQGVHTIASSEAQDVIGTYNIEDADGKYLHIVGNGEDEEHRSNAHTLDKNGNAWFAGDVYVGEGRKRLVTEEDIENIYVDNQGEVLATKDYVDETFATKAYVEELLGVIENGAY